MHSKEQTKRALRRQVIAIKVHWRRVTLACSNVAMAEVSTLIVSTFPGGCPIATVLEDSAIKGLRL